MRASDDDEDAERVAGSALETPPSGERFVDPRLDVFRDFVNSLESTPEGGGGKDGPTRRLRPAGRAGRLAEDRLRRAAARGRGSTHSRRRSDQKSFTARQTTDGFAPVGEPAVRG